MIALFLMNFFSVISKISLFYLSLIGLFKRRLIYLMLISQNAEALYCPKYCRCFFHNHLRHVRCVARGLISVDLDVPRNVEWLELSQNSIYELKDNIFQDVGLKHIIYLSLDNNAIQTIGLNAFVGLNNLEFLDLSNNHLYSLIPGIFERNQALTFLRLHGNPLRYMPGVHPFLISSSIQFLDVSNCRLRFVRLHSLRKMTSLKSINMSSNYLLTFDYDTLKDINHLKEIDLTSNALACDSRAEVFQASLNSSSFQVYGLPCLEITPKIPLSGNEKKMEKMVAIDRESTESFENGGEEDFKDLDEQLEEKCRLRKVITRTTWTPPLEHILNDKHNNQVNLLFLTLAFVNGIIVGITIVLSFWVCFRWFNGKNRDRSMYYHCTRYSGPPPAYRELYSP